MIHRFHQHLFSFFYLLHQNILHYLIPFPFSCFSCFSYFFLQNILHHLTLYTFFSYLLHKNILHHLVRFSFFYLLLLHYFLFLFLSFYFSFVSFSFFFFFILGFVSIFNFLLFNICELLKFSSSSKLIHLPSLSIKTEFFSISS